MNLLNRLREERRMRLKGGIYHLTQIKLCYNSNRIEGSRLTEEQTRYIYEMNTITTETGKTVNVDDLIEARNHFACFNYILDVVDERLSELVLRKFTGYSSHRPAILKRIGFG